MKSNTPELASELKKKRQLKKRWKNVVMAMASIVVFCTTYALILPAVTMEKTPICGMTEHEHTNQCYQVLTTTLDCPLELHQHSGECYSSDGSLACGYADFALHSHEAGCYDESGTLICALPEIGAHTHTDACYTAAHVHGEECYTTQRGELTCIVEEADHQHTDECYVCEQILTCELSDEPAEAVLVCQAAEIAPHEHSAECLDADGNVVCGQLQVLSHTHGDVCFVQTEAALICGLEEHVHDEVLCYSDTTADVESASDWEATLPQQLSGEWTNDLVAVAESQLGYSESVRNVQVDSGGRIKGYSRYGAWYGDAYGDWCAMFVSFCLNYAQIDRADFPYESGCYRYEMELKQNGLFVSVDENYSPKRGDIILFELNGNGQADHIGIVTEYIPAQGTSPAQIITIEGNTGNNCVEYRTYDASHASIWGYGVLPTQEFSCGRVGHTHTAQCGFSACGYVEHIHKQACFEAQTEDRAARCSAMIEALPSIEEFDAALSALEEAEDTDAYSAYYRSISYDSLCAYILYEDMDDAQRAMVTNVDKLFDYEWLWSSAKSLTRGVTQGIAVYQINSYATNAYTVLYSGQSPDEAGCTFDFNWWSAIIVEEDESGALYVSQCYTEGGVDKSAYGPETENGFALLVWHGTVAADALNVEVGNLVAVPFTYTSTQAYTGSSYGTVTFYDGDFKDSKDNSDKLTIVQSADTYNLIEVNLYDFNTAINDPWSVDSDYPGFQQDYGTTGLSGSETSLTKYNFNFGNNITSDLAAGEEGVTNSGGTINTTVSAYNGTTYGVANLPVEGAMLATLKDGYPALADGTSLAYMFTDNSGYATKKNTDNINGLFIHDQETGAYTFNSRENHAQFDASTNTFTLYEQIITSNFMMYPFGNFLPFNDIVELSAQTSTIDRAYLQSIAASAQYKGQCGYGDEYSTLATQLTYFIALMDAQYGTDWVAADAMNAYFEACDIPRTFTQDEELVQNLYSIDFDEPTDFFFGMEMKMEFVQPRNGLTGNDGQQEMIFRFIGDDDVWVYIDDVLFLDLTGIHRHVGGEIDFVRGEVRYYGLDVSTGDVAETPYKTVTFAEILGTTEGLNENGTFIDYSEHKFDFYYTERGAGSGVCRMNFNFPLIGRNAISVSKELSVDEEGELALLGNPDFSFQVLKANEDGTMTEELFIGAGVTYYIYDVYNEPIGTGVTDENGIFTLKAGQRAEFEDIPEDAGKYYVRELLDAEYFEQYGDVFVNGSSATTKDDVIFGADTFTGVNSPVKDACNGTTHVTFDNRIAFKKLGSLLISKELNAYTVDPATNEFAFYVTLDSDPISVGTEYTVSGEDAARTVETEGIILVPADATATISNIITGTEFVVRETESSSEGYEVSYSGSEAVTSDGSAAYGTIEAQTSVAVDVTNSELGTRVEIPIQKTIPNPNGDVHSFVFELVQVTDQSGNTLTEDGLALVLSVDVDETGSDCFTIAYTQSSLDTLPASFYYRINERNDGGAVLFDESVYVVEVVVSEINDVLSAELTSVWKDGQAMEDPAVGLSFSNLLLHDFSLTKRLSGITDVSEFSFKLEFVYDSKPISGDYIAEMSDGTATTLTLTDGIAYISLQADETILIRSLPYGTTWAVTELDAEAYKPSWQIGTDVEHNAVTAGGVVESGSDTVICTNTIAYILPETGAAGTHLYTIGGLLLTITAAILLLYNNRKRRKEDVASS